MSSAEVALKAFYLQRVDNASVTSAGIGEESRVGVLSAVTPSDESPAMIVATKKPWLISPIIDLLFCCGGFAWLSFAVCYFTGLPASGGTGAQILSVLSLIAAHGISEPHTAATLARIYKDKESTEKYQPWTKNAALICAALCLLGLTIPGVTPILAKIYLLWVVQHFTAQTFGFVLLYCYRGGYQPSKIEKLSLSMLMNCTAAFAIARQLTFYEWSGNGFLAQKQPDWPLLPVPIFNAVTYLFITSALIFAGLTIHRAFKSGQTMPLPACFTLATGVLMYTVGYSQSLLLTLFTPAFFHASQYLILTMHYKSKESKTAEIIRANKLDLPEKALEKRYYGFLVLVSAFIYIGLPRILQEIGVPYALAFATVFASVNIHHFTTDAGIWKLRDPRVRIAVVS